jgi:type IV pilus assembly protein PilM
MGLFNFFQRQLVGLDIGISGIKAIELSSQKNPRLLAYNRMPLPWNAIAIDGEIRDRASVVGALKSLFQNDQFSTKKVAVGASGKSVITKKITVPRMSREELAHQLYFEAEQYIPFDVSEVNVDFAILGPSHQSQVGTPMMDALIVAAKKDYIQSLCGMVQEAGLVPEVVDNQSFALGNAFEFNYGYVGGNSNPGAACVVIDFGAGTTKISIVEGDKTTFTRELRQCGVACTIMLSERLGVPIEQAERIKITESNAAAIKSIISEFTANLVEEISRTLDFSVGQNSDRSIQGIYICGGASRTEGLVQAMEQKMPAPVRPLNPIQNIAGSGRRMNAQALRELSYLGAVAIGLSLRSAGDAA